MTTAAFSLAPVFPDTTSVNAQQHLTIGGCDVTDLATQYGTPLYVFDEMTLRNKCKEFLREFGSRYPDVMVAYASKAYINKSLARVVAEEGLGFDVVSIGELAVVRAAEVALSRVHFHGNNKSREELAQAVDWGIGRVVVDNFFELEELERICAGKNVHQEILLRITPGVDPHTHAYISTGTTDSKFGFPLMTGDAAKAVAAAVASPHLRVVGLHMHLGSQLFEVDPYTQAIDGVLAFAADMAKQHGLRLEEFSPGGGFGVQYVGGEAPPPLSTYAQAITDALKAACAKHGLALPRLVLEPGRSIVGRAGVAVYRVGAVKDIPGVRKYVSVDGGMADNIRPAIYGSKYEAVVANRMDALPSEVVTLAGKYCESGDILINDVKLPALMADDLVVLPASGAYCLAMASNYNLAQKPAVLMVRDGAARVIRRRETIEDLLALDAD